MKTQFALCCGVLMLACAIAFTSWTLRALEMDLKASVIDVQRAIVHSTANDIEGKLALRRDALATIAPLLAQAAPAPGAEMDAFFKPRPVLQKMFDAVLVVDAAGQVIHDIPASGGDACLGRALANYPFFRELQAGSRLVLTPPMRPQSGSEPCLVYAAPLRAAGSSAIKGALVGVLNITKGKFLGAEHALRIGSEGRFAIVTLTDTPLFVLNREIERIATPTPGGKAHPVFVRAKSGEEGAIEWQDVKGTEILLTFQRLREAPWVLTAVFPTDEAFAGLRRRKQEVLLMGLGLGLFAGCAAWLLTGWLMRPLKRLRQLMQADPTAPGKPIEAERFGSVELRALIGAYNAQASSRLDYENRLKANERRLQAVMDNIPARVAYIDREERYTFINHHIGRAFGREPKKMLGRTMREVRGEEKYAAVRPYMQRAYAGEAVSFESVGLEEGGKPYHYKSSYIPDSNDAGEIQGFYLVAFDISELKETQLHQAEIEERLRAITDNLPVLISYLDRDLHYRFMNATFKEWLGIDPAQAIGMRMDQVIKPEVFADRRQKFIRCLNGERLVFDMQAETLLGTKDLQISYIPDLHEDGYVAGFYTLSQDVTELKQAQRRLAEQALTDGLTGLPNRTRFEEALMLALQRSSRSGLAVAVLFLDIDHFKQINDKLGHAAGDAVLQEFASRLRRSVRIIDTSARLAGDEFVVVLEGLHNEGEAEAVARKIMAVMIRPFRLDSGPLRVTASLGIAFHHRGPIDPKALLAQADRALYEAKAAGRNAYRMAMG